MNNSVVILAIVAAVVCGQMDQQGGGQGGPGGRGGGGPGGRGGHGGRGGRGHHGPPPPPYLRNVTDDARREYFGIITNMNETITQQNQDILTWAQKYGVQMRAAVQEFNANMTKMRAEVKQNVTTLIGQLPAALQQFSAVMENEDQTRIQQRRAIEDLTMTNPQIFHLIDLVNGQHTEEGDMMGGGGRGGQQGGNGVKLAKPGSLFQ
ncbi:unnamed protein product [Heligmosomoides polygyrus]|uniref:DUF148 domain-containing protein n=1 Tax=Heligmosomoides polygyrus TaxID=6339 RepID=A0A183G9V6_HELPZ|nr:unnamed protein product [Heligmosomoides polygyrus]